MSKHKHIDKICCVAVTVALLLTVLFINGESLGIKAAGTVLGYEGRLFDSSRVHTVDIVMDDWDGFIETCRSEEYSSCSVVIDGEAYTGVGIRGKGNTSLSSVSSMNSSRYSFKIEFDQYDSTKSYYGLDKLSLNNLIQDNTFMKDYLVYQMMYRFGVDAPLCSFVYITVNGEDWGLYLAVEGIEDAFLQRNYGSDYGELYKPDSMSFGGGRGNGKDFDFSDFDFSGFASDSNAADSAGEDAIQIPDMPQGDIGAMPDMGNQMPESFDPSQMFGGQMPQGNAGGMPDMGGMPEGFDPSQMFGGQMPQGNASAMPDMGSQMPEGFDPSQMFGGQMPQGNASTMPDMGGQMPEGSDPSQMFGGQMPQDDSSSINSDSSFPGGFGKGGFGMGSSDVKLQYIDDDPDSYSNIFNNAKTDATDADKTRLIDSLKSLDSGEKLSDVVDIEEVIRYFVVHNFVVNGDSYTGGMIHNYYLYEEDGQLSMIPWDYNLAFGTFQGSSASNAVNDPIDTPVSGGTEDRPMIDWIFSSEEYTELYHRYFNEFISEFFATGYMDEMIASTIDMISPYVEKDPTKFCTYDEFVLGTDTIRHFCRLRAESVAGQLDGTVPSTSSEQAADSSALVDASAISLSAMGTMGGGFGGGRREDFSASPTTSSSDVTVSPSDTTGHRPDGFEGFSLPQFGSNTGGNGNRPGRPDNTSGSDVRPGGDRWQNSFPGQGQVPDGMGGNSASSWVLLAVSAAVLAFGLLVVWKYRR